jgi:hypothetical protein
MASILALRASAARPPWVQDRHTPAARLRRRRAGYELQVGSTKNLPPRPSCSNGQYQTLSGGDSAEEPYPHRD